MKRDDAVTPPLFHILFDCLCHRLFSSRRLMVLTLASAVLGCSGGKNPDLVQVPPTGKSTVITGISFDTVELEKIAANENSQFLIATSPLSEVRSSLNFELRARLQPGGTVTLTTFGENTVSGAGQALQLKNSLALRFSRPIGGNRLTVEISASGKTDNWSTFFQDLDASAPLHLSVDVHNDESGEAHVLIWNLHSQSQNSVQNSEQSPLQSPLIDSALDVPGSPGKGFGRYWGFLLNGSELLATKVSEPRYEH